MLFRVSIDVGGTFTDLVALDEEKGTLLNIKVPSVPKNPEKGVCDALSQFLKTQDPDDVRMISHATTIATNALLGQVDLELPRVGLVTTRGFRDIIEIGRQRRAEVYNLFFQRPTMLVQRQLRKEVDERVEANGIASKPVDEAELTRVYDELKGADVTALVIAFLNSYVNPVNEEVALRLAKTKHVCDYVTASSELNNEYREYERFSTAVVNASLMPIIHRYLKQLEADLRGLGVKTPLYVMQSNGGLSTAQIVAEKPFTIVESGPAAGVIAAAWVGSLTGAQNVISFDMGGTTAKAGTVRGATPEVVSEYEVAGRIHMGRLVKGSGYAVRFPFIDLAECSSGGGTIAWSEQGSLKVGPTSAGAYPGPACYGRGGKNPTITDANLLLGNLNPNYLLGGSMKINHRFAEDALRRLGNEIGMEIEETARSVIKIANSMMGKILKIVSVERGYDPRLFSLVAFGGAGPMHVCSLASELEVDRIIVPPNPGMFSALGLLTADLFHDFTKAMVKQVTSVDPEEMETEFCKLEETGRSTLKDEGVKDREISLVRQVDLRYYGQAYELTVEGPRRVTVESLKETSDLFHRRHAELYDYAADSEPVELVNLRLRAVGMIAKPKAKRRGKRVEPELVDKRKVFFESLGWLEIPVAVKGEELWSGSLDGPLIIEQYDATTVVHPEWAMEMDEFGNMLLRRRKN